MIEDLEELNKDCFGEIALIFSWTKSDGTFKEVLLKREDDFEVERSFQNVFRGLTSEIKGIKNGDTLKSPFYKNEKELKVITVNHWGDEAHWVLITAEDFEDLSYG